MLFMGPVSAPAIKQYYSYATDTRCKRLGNHAWVRKNTPPRNNPQNLIGHLGLSQGFEIT